MPPRKRVSAEAKEPKKKTSKVVEVAVTETETEDGTVSHATATKQQEVSKRRRLLTSKRIIFVFGTAIGVLLAAYFGHKQIDSPFLPDLDKLVNFDSFTNYWEEWYEMLPASMQGTMDAVEGEKLRGSSDSFAIGKQMKGVGLEAKHPVVMIPGVISTGIESWSLEGTEECPSEPHFRKRLWGSFYMIRTMVLDKACWLKHIMLDPETGLDPPGIRLRAAQGFDAADYFMTGYWIWNKVLQNLAVIGYGPDNMLSAGYDWRLAYLDLERRDGFFSKLKSQIEMYKKQRGEKAVLVSHSMGSQVVYYFLQWVEAKGEHFGGGGPNWVNDNIEAYVDISGSVLGTPKAIVALLSGEMKDTVQLNALAVQGLEKFFSRRERLDMLRTFGGIPSMFPKGGDLIWGNLTYAPDDVLKSNETTTNSLGQFITFDEDIGTYSNKNLTIAQSIDYLLDQSPEWFVNRVQEQYSFGLATTKKQLELNKENPSKWSNPLEVPLPNAPDMKIYCLYGVGNPTERAYHYREEVNKDVSKLNVSIEATKESSVLLGDGDGTVSLMTHTMCHKWKEPGNIFNPGNSKVTVVEMKHEPDRFDIRGGAKTAEHVDILGSAALNELVLRIAAGDGLSINDTYHTSLKDIVSSLDF
ncbi:unnamed protein product [Kuraishia capsulata CBS 1993]|uniref:Phospholipid:diacylglycerol acyltransferase n=1 Tax=Kuraishia capsulata CBS 1993 TaxID=1382522 RepID=W6MPI4_9ASCO|nr:uncharacterized protein KUCA_T00002994001 [Kuraishia capsulata CBS 1993]CDK27017.1 unnamed protein product [Kuraishia capsulata CBS 1993]